MAHPAEMKSDKAAELKEKLARLKSDGGNGQTAAPTPAPSNGKSVEATPAKKRGVMPKTPVKSETKPVAKVKKDPIKKDPVKKDPVKKEVVKKEPRVLGLVHEKVAAEKAPRKAAKAAEEKAPKRAAPQKEVHRSMDREKKTDGLRPVERDIIKIIKAKRGKPISIRDVAIAMFGEDKVIAADNSESKDNEMVRVVRNGIRIPCAKGVLVRWTDTGEPNAKRGYVMMSGSAPTPPPGAAARAKAAVKETVKEKVAVKKAKIKAQ